MTTAPIGRHVHFPEGLASGSHNPPEAFRRDAHSALNAVSDAASDAATQIRDALYNTVVNVQSRFYGLRKEVPFERWFYHYGLELNLSDAQLSDKIKARGWAVLSLGESLVRYAATLPTLCFNKVFSRPADHNYEMLYAYSNSISLSFSAIISPEEAVRAATKRDENGHIPIGPLLGSSSTARGTPYYGE